MKILVTGGAGYIGSVTVEQLLNLGHEVVVFDNLTEGHRAAIDPRARFLRGDLNDARTIAVAVAAAQPEAVVHFAANALVGESMQNPSKYFRNNVSGGLHLLDAMVEHGVGHIVFSSTCATFGQPDKMPIDETAVQKPINPYGESKLMFERILDWYGTIHGITSVALRYFNAAGASERFGEDHRVETHLIPNILRVALGKSPHVDIYGTDYETPDGTCIRDFIHILDLAQAHILALESRKTGRFNLGTGQGSSIREAIECCRAVTGHAIPARELPRRPGDPARLVASSEKIRTELGWNPKFPSLEPIVRSAWKWHVAHPDGYGD